MTPEKIAQTITAIIADLKAAGTIKDVELPPAVVERPRNRDHGDWATNVALQYGKRLGIAPRDLATLVVEKLQATEGIAAASVAGPGFVNITLAADAAADVILTILAGGFGRVNDFAGEAINVEFVSANPTGPIHVGGVRWAAVGDNLARILEAAGASVTREYYVNDHGSQIDRFGASILAVAKGQEPPEDGYQGLYIADIAEQIISEAAAAGEVDPRTLPQTAAVALFSARGMKIMFDEIKRSMHEFRTDFDVYFSEHSVHTSDGFTHAVERLRHEGHVYEADGAVWLRTTDLGDDKDRVLVRSNGQPTYFASDCAYYLDKRERGADRVIIVLGADHHGYVGRMMAMCSAFGDTPGVNLEIPIGQMVNLVRDGEQVKMSKRAGTVVTMEDFVEAVGVDAARYAVTRYALDTTIDLDIDLLTSHTMENPVFYVQYAHARTVSVATKAAAVGVRLQDGFDPSCLTHETESVLLGVLAAFPSVVRHAAKLREPHRVARYVEEVATAYHKWYDQCRVSPFGDEAVSDMHRTRLALNEAVGQVLRDGLELLGVSAPERM